MATVITCDGTITVPLDKIYVPQNVRELDPEHVDALAGSIALQGQLVPVLVAVADGEPAAQGFDYELVAGFHRFAAVAKLQHTALDAILREPDEENEPAAVAAARATENITRKQLNPHEEACAVKAMLERGLSDDGTAQALGWPKARVTARLKLLELPETAQKLVGSGTIPLACVDTLRGIGEVSEPVLNTVVDYIADGGDWIVDDLQTDTGKAVGRALHDSASKTFAAYLTHIDAREIETLRLGKKATAQLKEIEQLHKQLHPYSYGPPPIRFNEQDFDQARAARVLIEGDGVPVIIDKPLYRELCKDALTRAAEELREQAARAERQRAAQKALDLTAKAVDPAAELKRAHRRQMRQFAAQAHGVNIDLGWALRKGLGSVDPSDMTVARFFAYAALGPDHHSGYGKTGETVLRLAVDGIRLVVEEFRTDVTRIRKDGSRGALRIDYGKRDTPEDTVAWLWKYIDGARNAGDLYGRVLVVIAAEQYASRLVVPASQQHPAIVWYSRNGQAAKALAKLAGPHLPASLKQLEKAIKQAKAEYDEQLKQLERAQRALIVEDEPQQRPSLHVGTAGVSLITVASMTAPTSRSRHRRHEHTRAGRRHRRPSPRRDYERSGRDGRQDTSALDRRAARSEARARPRAPPRSHQAASDQRWLAAMGPRPRPQRAAALLARYLGWPMSSSRWNRLAVDSDMSSTASRWLSDRTASADRDHGGGWGALLSSVMPRPLDHLQKVGVRGLEPPAEAAGA